MSKPNHLSPEPPPSWAWTIAPDQHAGKFFTQQQHPYHRQQQQRQLLPEGNPGRELLFEKPLTPSDVGKLNRLVIPKQHAERHFPLDADCSEKGLLLSFEDESGRAWQFRYSYWTSSQSYVLTKGWSRFVKEKRLDAGDVVLFERRRDSGGGRLYIGCKRRGELADVQDDGVRRAAAQWNPECYGAAGPSPLTERAPNPTERYLYTTAAPSGPPHDAGDQAAGSSAKAIRTSSRRLRLFGVNLDCGPEQEQPESNDNNSGSSVESQGLGGRFQFMRRGTGWQ
ncbi:hypothetical protein Taro_028210 [Colocasia esculenta]|uniref:TF-B3 domain-containing protein n=1 Tax=Colocasia esculenta TaxID=4460 RepID=A0A843VGN5_COLES|nr:hypothetical protein [Colocasia esculenta]